MPSAALSYGNSKKWIAPKIQEKQKKDRLNQARSKICKDSPFWSIDFDIETHKREFNILLQTRLQEAVPSSPPQTPPSIFSDLTTSSTITSSTLASSTTGSSTITSPCTPSRPAFSGKTHEGPDFTSNLSPVLSLPTVFTPHYKLGKPALAPWPSRSEMKYEGDDRIATDKLHGRFPGAPRVEGNETVNWQHRNVIEQYPLENYHLVPSEAAVMLKSHYIDEADHATEDEARHMLGSELLEMLDPVDRL
jgi:hypothetical protein